MYDAVKYAELKRKLRALRNLEKKLQKESVSNSARHGSCCQQELLWSTYFDLGEGNKKPAKYSLLQLERMSREELKAVMDDFLCLIFTHYGAAAMERENDGVQVTQCEEVRKEMRELLKKCHPDNGGDSEQFIKVFEKYQKLKKGIR